MEKCWNPCKSAFKRVLNRLLVKKRWPDEDSPLNRCLTPFDAYCLCMGAIIRSVFWEIPMEVDRQGHNILFSTAVASVFITATAATYCELASVLPSTSATYDFVYHFIGEFPAFLVGWSIIFNSSIRLVCVTSFFGEAFEHALLKRPMTPANQSFMFVHYTDEWNLFSLKDRADFYCVGLVTCFTIMFIFSTRNSRIINNFFVLFGYISAITFFLILWVNVNWWETHYPPFQSLEEINTFFLGCFFIYFGFLDFDVLLCIGEEINEPKRSVPKLIGSVWKHTLLSFLGILTVVSADKVIRESRLDNRLPITTILDNYVPSPKSLILITGSFCTLFSTIYSRIFVISRVLYTMSRDGLMLPWFSYVSNYNRIPVVSCGVFCIVTLLCTIYFKPTRLFMRAAKCGYIFVKIMATVCLLINRYSCDKRFHRRGKKSWNLMNTAKSVNSPTPLEDSLARKYIAITVLSAFVTSLMIQISIGHVSNNYTTTGLVLSVILLIIFTLLLDRQPQHSPEDITKFLAGCPFSAIICLLFDLIMLDIVGLPPLLLQLSWIALGILHYFSYSFFFSVTGKEISAERKSNEISQITENERTPEDYEEIPKSVGSEQASASVE